ncbi:MAG: DNA mismatch endonuclease Vsr [Terracidiphilus sp.]
MTDRISTPARSQNMRSIRSKDTKPEMRVRLLLYGLGHRYRLHVKSLPGCPDIVFRSRRKALFVHGCFWHQHKGCHDAHLPKSRLSYWGPKLRCNVERDRRNAQLLRDAGWATLTVWACELADEKALASRLKKFLK